MTEGSGGTIRLSDTHADAVIRALYWGHSRRAAAARAHISPTRLERAIESDRELARRVYSTERDCRPATDAHGSRWQAGITARLRFDQAEEYAFDCRSYWEGFDEEGELVEALGSLDPFGRAEAGLAEEIADDYLGGWPTLSTDDPIDIEIARLLDVGKDSELGRRLREHLSVREAARALGRSNWPWFTVSIDPRELGGWIWTERPRIRSIAGFSAALNSRKARARELIPEHRWGTALVQIAKGAPLGAVAAQYGLGREALLRWIRRDPKRGQALDLATSIAGPTNAAAAELLWAIFHARSNDLPDGSTRESVTRMRRTGESAAPLVRRVNE